MRALLLASILSVSGAVCAHAQTNTVQVAPKYMDGRLTGCEVAFDNYLRDTAYLQAAPVHVAGSWAVHNWPDRGFWGMLKVGVKPLSGASVGDTLAPADAYIIVDYASNKADQKFGIESDTPGFKLFGFDASGEQTMLAIVAPNSGEFTVAYTFGEGRVPTTFPVVLSDREADAYSRCLDALLSEPGDAQ